MVLLVVRHSHSTPAKCTSNVVADNTPVFNDGKDNFILCFFIFVNM